MGDGQHTIGAAEGKIGRILEGARKEKGLTLEEAERSTKIRRRYLEGLERDDYTVLPDAVYARGFLKTYANFLGLDGENLSRELKTRRRPRRERAMNYRPPGGGDFERPIMSPGGVAGTEKRKIPTGTVVTIVVAVLVLATLVGALYYVGLGARSSAVEGEARPAGGGEARVGPEVAPARREEAPAGRLTVGVQVEGTPAWIRVSSDSETVYEAVAEPGFARTFEARRVVGIRAGDAGAVSVRVNGQQVGTLGEPGEVLERSYTLKSES